MRFLCRSSSSDWLFFVEEWKHLIFWQGLFMRTRVYSFYGIFLKKFICQPVYFVVYVSLLWMYPKGPNVSLMALNKYWPLLCNPGLWELNWLCLTFYSFYPAKGTKPLFVWRARLITVMDFNLLLILWYLRNVSYSRSFRVHGEENMWQTLTVTNY